MDLVDGLVSEASAPQRDGGRASVSPLTNSDALSLCSCQCRPCAEYLRDIWARLLQTVLCCCYTPVLPVAATTAQESSWSASKTEWYLTLTATGEMDVKTIAVKFVPPTLAVHYEKSGTAYTHQVKINTTNTVSNRCKVHLTARGLKLKAWHLQNPTRIAQALMKRYPQTYGEISFGQVCRRFVGVTSTVGTASDCTDCSNSGSALSAHTTKPKNGQ